MKRFAMLATFALVMAILAGTASQSNAAQWRCTGYGSSSHCWWVYSEQELHERGQRNAIRELDYNSRGGTRRASDRACKAAIEAGVDNDLASSYGCRE